MAALLFDGWVQPQAAKMARATQVVFRIEANVVGRLIGRLMRRKTRGANVFDPVMIGDVYHHA
jgi:hypothetical protein